MTGNFLLDWAILSVSLFNTILLVWLGLTVLLNAERRTWGVWLVGGGLLAGGGFFISHSAILGVGSSELASVANFWWQVGWLPVILAPLAWYVLVLWFVGFWEVMASRLYRRHLPWLSLLVLLAAVLITLMLFTNPIPSFSQLSQLNLVAGISIGGIPLMIVVYPVFILLCVGLSLDALRHPGPSRRMMGNIARQRARPWLISTAFVLLAVTLLVSGVSFWVVLNAWGRVFDPGIILTVGWFDLVIGGLIGLAVTLVGQSIVTYEVFTGKTLPRRGLRRHWRRLIILAVGMAVLLGGGFVYGLHPIYSVLTMVLVVISFYALLNWRLFHEREVYIERLRPFVASQRLFDNLVASASQDVDVHTPFSALCVDVLGCTLAYLIPKGPLAPLVESILVFPVGRQVLDFPTSNLFFEEPSTICLPVDPNTHHGAVWLVPLWSERGLSGLLYLGEKSDRSLYSQEEIEIAQTISERLIDTQASYEIAQRLVSLQRDSLAESQVADRRVRRALHDEVLPQLHATMLSLKADHHPEEIAQLAEIHTQLADLLREMPPATTPAFVRKGLLNALRQLVDGEFGGTFSEVTWKIEPGVEASIAALHPLPAEVLFYAARESLRNAAHYGGVPGKPLNLKVGAHTRTGLTLIIEDDGVGIDRSQKDRQSGGQGLALHSTMMAVIGGTLIVESEPGAYTRVILNLPNS